MGQLIPPLQPLRSREPREPEALRPYGAGLGAVMVMLLLYVATLFVALGV